MDREVIDAINVELDKLIKEAEEMEAAPEVFVSVAPTEESLNKIPITFATLCGFLRRMKDFDWEDMARNSPTPALQYALENLVVMARFIEATQVEARATRDTRTFGARKAASARHAESRAMAQELFEWFRENETKFSSLDAAAEAADKVVPLSFRTRRRHIGEAARKLRSTRKE